MKFRPATIGTLFRAELRMLLRDRRTVIVSLVLPLAVMPVMLLCSNWTVKHREQTLREMVYHYAVGGPQAEAVNAILAAAGYNFRRLLAWFALLLSAIWMALTAATRSEIAYEAA